MSLRSEPSSTRDEGRWGDKAAPERNFCERRTTCCCLETSAEQTGLASEDPRSGGWESLLVLVSQAVSGDEKVQFDEHHGDIQPYGFLIMPVDLSRAGSETVCIVCWIKVR